MEPCKNCQGTHWRVIRRISDRYRCGFITVAIRCFCSEQIDGKSRAASLAPEVE